MPRSRYRIYADGSPYFLTCTILGWLPLFDDSKCREIVLESLAFLIREQRLRLHGYVIMPEHLHLIASGEGLSQSIGSFKSFTARKMVDDLTGRCEAELQYLSMAKKAHKLDQSYQVWEEGSHPQEVRGEKTYLQKLEYMHWNPVKRGLAASPEGWELSSHGDFSGRPGRLPVELIVY